MSGARSHLPVWVGMVDVQPTGDRAPFTNVPGAFANAVTEALDEADYRRRVRTFLGRIDLKVVGFKDVELPTERRKSSAVPNEILALAASAQQSVTSSTTRSTSTATNSPAQRSLAQVGASVRDAFVQALPPRSHQAR